MPRREWSSMVVKGSDLPSREYHDVCIERTPIRELKTVLRKAGYLSVILEFNLPIDYQLARANICLSHQWSRDEKHKQLVRSHRNNTR
jgi:hypothetical protein